MWLTAAKTRAWPGVRLLLLFALASCLVQQQRVDAVVQGEADTAAGNSTGLFPMVCALLRRRPGGGFSVTCSATLMNPTTLITAAHCEGKFTDVSCDSEISGMPNVLRLGTVTTYPDWEGTSDNEAFREDIAVVTILDPVPGARTATVPAVEASRDMYDAGELGDTSVITLVGYGYSRDVSELPDEVRASLATERRFTTAEFKQITNKKIAVNAGTAGGRGEGGAICEGDSGGAMFLGDPAAASARPVLVGIINLSDPRCIKTALAHRTDITSAQNFFRLHGAIIDK